jgi:hypothetical protein
MQGLIPSARRPAVALSQNEKICCTLNSRNPPHPQALLKDTVIEAFVPEVGY